MTKKSLIKGNMRKLSGSAAVVCLAMGVLGSTQALAGIASTKHNLGSTSTTGNNKTTGTGDICVFCHTPHGADTSAAVPLWNRTLATPSSYTTYNSLGTSSLDGATAPVGSVSLACLSCHDGSQAMNTMINAPGSGSTAIGGTWSGANQTAGKITGTYSQIGTDLRNDHPVGIQYAGGPSGGTIPATGDYTTFFDPDFRTAKSVALNGTQVWYVDNSGTTSRQKTDMQLYTRSVTAWNSGIGQQTIASGTAQPYVECASCHDPHTENTTFLRVSNVGSAVCLACHIK